MPLIYKIHLSVQMSGDVFYCAAEGLLMLKKINNTNLIYGLHDSFVIYPGSIFLHLVIMINTYL